MKWFQEPSHILGQDLHGLDAFLVFFNIADIPADLAMLIVEAEHDNLHASAKEIHGA